MRIVVGLLVALLSLSVNATVITFDEASGVFDDGYGGLNWSGFGRINATTFGNQSSGIVQGNMSSDYTAYTTTATTLPQSGFDNPSIVSVASGTFDFNGMYITAVFQEGLVVHIKGLLAGVVKDSQTFTVDYDTPVFTNSNFLGIDTLHISRVQSSGVNVVGTGDQVAIDNFIINDAKYMAVPEPSSIAVLGLGLAILGVTRRRKSRLA